MSIHAPAQLGTSPATHQRSLARSPAGRLACRHRRPAAHRPGPGRQAQRPGLARRRPEHRRGAARPGRERRPGDRPADPALGSAVHARARHDLRHRAQPGPLRRPRLVGAAAGHRGRGAAGAGHLPARPCRRRGRAGPGRRRVGGLRRAARGLVAAGLAADDVPAAVHADGVRRLSRLRARRGALAGAGRASASC